LRKRVAETKQETAAHESTQVLASTLENGADNHDGAANGNWELAAKAIGDEGTEGIRVSFRLQDSVS
jgi:hypothetical protein